MRSDKTKKGLERAPHRSLMRATGMSSDDIKKPFIAICNSFNEVIPGHAHLDQVGRLLKKAVRKAGGTPIEFNMIGCEWPNKAAKGSTSFVNCFRRGNLPSRSAAKAPDRMDH